MVEHSDIPDDFDDECRIGFSEEHLRINEQRARVRIGLDCGRRNGEFGGLREYIEHNPEEAFKSILDFGFGGDKEAAAEAIANIILPVIET